MEPHVGLDSIRRWFSSASTQSSSALPVVMMNLVVGGALVVEELERALAVDRVRWERVLVHAGVPGPIEQQVRIGRQDERLLPDLSDVLELLLRELRLLLARQQDRVEVVVHHDEVVAVDRGPIRRSDRHLPQLRWG